MLNKLFCKHKEIEFLENLYGDKINHYSGKEICRSLWRCKNCGKIIKNNKLFKEEKLNGKN